MEKGEGEVEKHTHTHENVTLSPANRFHRVKPHLERNETETKPTNTTKTVGH